MKCWKFYKRITLFIVHCSFLKQKENIVERTKMQYNWILENINKYHKWNISVSYIKSIVVASENCHKRQIFFEHFHQNSCFIRKWCCLHSSKEYISIFFQQWHSSFWESPNCHFGKFQVWIVNWLFRNLNSGLVNIICKKL